MSRGLSWDLAVAWLRTLPEATPPITHLSLLEVLGGRSGFGLRPRGFGGGFSATEKERVACSRTVRRAGTLGTDRVRTRVSDPTWLPAPQRFLCRHV